MSERTHSNPIGAAAPRKSKLFPILAGTVAAVLIAGVAFQVYRAETADAQTRRTAEAAGAARVENTAPSQSSASSQVDARVNGQIISRELVENECYERYKGDVIENLINRLIIQQECERRGVTITKAEIKQEVHNIAAGFKLDSETWYKMLQAERGINPEQYQLDVIWPMLALKKLAGADVQITEEELQKAFIRDYGPRVEARMIVMDGNVKRAIDVQQQAVADPDSFQKLAQEHSSDTTSRALGGAIPPIRRYGTKPGTPQEKIEKQAFEMQPGEISPVMQMEGQRWAILKCEGHTKAIVPNMTEEVRVELIEQLKDEKTQEAVATVFQQLKENARVDNLITGESTAPVRQTGATQPAARDSVQTADATQFNPQ
ncbi:MAG: peptidylprolyl isomerase [Planctomycetota bacterium]|nr:MAG: peptidylprolyl isomerase [Planctomycetota bacterium]REJ92258.1 MAG: peptidylprolyl isomerase [Planctomycetota bacterium]REK29761.1 MAG: peptidylprolyl isomerase [Planctomycetota bacterium]REK30418.1 MAG: peptidylprolyl isomerase [Planctomycetota bacterium]